MYAFFHYLFLVVLLSSWKAFLNSFAPEFRGVRQKVGVCQGVSNETCCSAERGSLYRRLLCCRCEANILPIEKVEIVCFTHICIEHILAELLDLLVPRGAYAINSSQ